MTPTPQHHEPSYIPNPQQEKGNRIVISGMSGLYPQSNNIKEFSEILYNKVNPVTEEDLRFKYNHPEVPQNSGSIPTLSYFDAHFFKVHYRLANAMDPMAKKVLEQAYQAIYDAGINSEQLWGKKVGVYIGACFSETEKARFYETALISGFGIAGCSRSMFANRISYWLNAKGPSMAIDESCCSSTAALEQAYLALSRGECEAAIVGGTYLCLHPHSSVHYGRVIKLCNDGATKSFDERADGCAKSEAINVLFLQREKDAKRIYAEVLYVKTEFTCMLETETGPKYGFYRGVSTTSDFLNSFYKEARIPPQAIEYVEAFGSGISEVDKVELQAIEDVFCKNRDDPLLIGSVMSNIGYGEAAAGISAITKVLLGYHNGQIAANLHYEQPRKDIAALSDGRMRVVSENQQFGRSYVAVNGMSVTGVNSHVLLHGCYKPKDLSRYSTSLPYLVTVSGRHEEAVKYMLEILKSNPIDPEQLALLHNIHRMNISGHLGRGYIILKTNEEQETVSLHEKMNYFNDARRPLWFVYSGMGSQWSGMGVQLMRIPIFAAAIERCRKVLEPKGIDIVHIITSDDKSIFDNILHSFVGIAAIQIGLTDILHELELKPDGIIGHSVGELGCAYADGCLTAEEMILSAYYRGLVSVETEFIHGSMAAVGVGYDQISKICPSEIEVACRNGPQSSTISGPSVVMREFVAALTAKGIFAKEVPCSNIAYHSRYIADAGPGLLKYLKDSIKTPKVRSQRWLSTSVPKDKWNEPIAKLCSAEYLTNNLLNPVLFEETSRQIPTNAVLVEIAPHGLLQAILKRSMPASCKNISLTRRKHPDNTLLLLEAIGELYMEGYNCNIQVLYPKVEMPVSTGTPFLSHFVKWAHDEKWTMPLYRSASRRVAAVCNVVLALHDKEHTYLRGHSIRGFTLYPFAASLTLAWDLLAMILNVPKKQLSVMFNDLKFYTQPVLHDRRQLKLNVSMHRGTGYFEILDGISKVITGFIRPSSRYSINYGTNNPNGNMHIQSDDIYQLLRDRDYFYSGDFQSIACVDESLSDAMIVWSDNWITFIDGMIQLNALRQPHNAVTQPTNIQSIIIDVQAHSREVLQSNKSDTRILMSAKVVDKYNHTRCGGVIVEKIKFQKLPPHSGPEMILKSLDFENSNEHHGDCVREYDSSEIRSTLTSQKVTLQGAEFGDYDSLKWVENLSVLTGSGITVNVHYVGINNNDLKNANGSLFFKKNVNNSYGMDFSGITNSGKPVMGLVRSGAASSQVRAQPELVWPVPAHWSLEDAATVPLAYVQAFYCLGIKMELIQGQSVFVHGGAGALGQAIISIALALDCEVYTTVRDVCKKHFLQKLFPALKADHIGCSRDHSFSEMVQIVSEGKKCDIVISCVKGKLKDMSYKCISARGLFFDISQLHNGDDYTLGMSFFQQEKNYISVDFSSIFESKNIKELKTIHKMVSEGITRGYVRPLSRVTYGPNEVARAFRLLAASSHRGRVLLRMKENTIQAHYRMRCKTDSTNLILCGKTPFGLQFADRLVSRGAKQLYLHVPTQSSYLQHKIRLWQTTGINVVVSSEPLNSHNAVVSLLISSLQLGPLEGIYLVAEETNTDHTLIRNLDAETRNLGIDLSNFAVICFGDNFVNRNICSNLLSDQLPTTVLMLPEMKEESYSSCTYWRAALDATERALQSTHRVILAQENRHKPSLLEQIAKIAEISIPDNAAKSLTLEDLGIKNHKLQLLCTFLQVQYNLALDQDQVLSLTINTILETERKLIDLPFEDIKGLSSFLRYIDSDELLATTEIVFLPTLVSGASMRDNILELNQTKLYLVPGIEGHHERFRVLCERLKLPALVLQPGLDHPHETVVETARRLAQVLLKKTGMQDKFYLLGYESGIFVALEIAAILEEHGLSGKVFCVGCTPEEFVNEVEEQLSSFKDEEQLQDGVLRHMYSLMTGDDCIALDNALQNISTWSQKIEICVRTLLGGVSHSAQYTRSLIQCALSRINQTRHYSITPRLLRSQVILLRAAMKHGSLKGTALQKISEQPLIVYQLETPLAHITMDLRCATIINEHLDPEMLENYTTKNICDTYLLNADSFVLE